jgi:hypothetical protein
VKRCAESDDALIAQTRAAALQVQRAHLDPAKVEYLTIRAVAGAALAERAWHDARRVSEAARRAAWGRLRERFGARDPHRGWLNAFLFLTLIPAAFALVTALGVRGVANDTGAAGWLGVVVAVMDVVLLAVARTRPLSGAFPRALLPTPLLLAATAIVLAAGDLPGTAGAAVGAAVSAGTFGWVVAMRRRDPQATLEMDTAIPTALLDAAPLAREGAQKVERDLLTDLGVDRAAQVVRVRDAVLADLAPDRPKLQDAEAGAPAGAFIVGRLSSEWVN